VFSARCLSTVFVRIRIVEKRIKFAVVPANDIEFRAVSVDIRVLIAVDTDAARPNAIVPHTHQAVKPDNKRASVQTVICDTHEGTVLNLNPTADIVLDQYNGSTSVCCDGPLNSVPNNQTGFTVDLDAFNDSILNNPALAANRHRGRRTSQQTAKYGEP
jgi:hypothetical protein